MMRRGPGNMLLAPTLAVMLLPLCYGLWKPPQPALTSPERELAALSSSPFSVASPAPRPAFSGLSWPIRPAAKKAAAVPRPSLANLPPLPGPLMAKNSASAVQIPELRYNSEALPELSMIYSDGAVKAAVIDGTEAHEGSALGHYKVVRIEETRVLLRRAGKDTWLRLAP